MVTVNKNFFEHEQYMQYGHLETSKTWTPVVYGISAMVVFDVNPRVKYARGVMYEEVEDTRYRC